MKRLLLILICITILLCGCETNISGQNVLGAYGSQAGDKPSEKEYTPLTELNMLYYSDMDTNPATTNCLANHEILKFVYSPLITVNAGFEPICILAESWTIDQNSVIVKIKSGLRFSNGESVLAKDVIKSVNAARYAPQSPYYSSASALYGVYQKDELTVEFKFKNADVDCLAMLDFPIMYNGKEGYGCGAYVFSEKNGKSVLVPNENYFENASVPVINLIETKNDSYIDDLFSSGSLDIISSSFLVEELSLTSLIDYNIVSCPSNRFIYLGVNFANQQLADFSVRNAISSVIDRKELAEQTLVGLASATNYPFNPEWYKMKNSAIQSVKAVTEADVLQSKSVLADTEFTLTVSATGYKNTLAKKLVEMFKNAGITLKLKELEQDAYLNAITTGNFELYLGECTVSKNMDPTFLYSLGGNLNYGGYYDAELEQAFLDYKTGTTDLATYLKAFDKKLPVIPMMFGKSALYCVQGIAGFADRSAFNIYGNSARITLKK